LYAVEDEVAVAVEELYFAISKSMADI